MKKFPITLLILSVFCPGIFGQSVSKSRYLKPVNFQKRVTTVISNKKRSYYSLNADIAAIINIAGPGTLRLRTRGRFTPDASKTIAYEIICIIDGAEQKTLKKSGVKRSTQATYLNGALGVPGQLIDFEVKLGRGNHTVAFKLGKNSVPVAARFSFTPGKAKKQDWISFSPLQPSEPVDLISRESTVKYYRFGVDKALAVEVNGPTELRVLTRIENHYQMKGRIDYRMQVKENGEVINTFQLSSKRSEIASYASDASLIPGKACEFVIEVPNGRHHYEILLMDKGKSTVLGRFLLPKKDVKLEN